MLFEFRRYAAVLMSSAVLLLLLIGCGGGGTADSDGGGFTVRGKITLVDGAPFEGATVKLYKTSYTIHTIDGFYSTRDSSGLESILLNPDFVQSTTNGQGEYRFTGLSSGKYTIVPTSNTHVFKWSNVPTRNNIGVVAITDSGMVYIYNPDGLGNKLSEDGTIIYNIGTPFTITGNVLDGQNFMASLPGGV